MRQLDTQIDEFLTRYAATLSTFDAPATADLWATPGLILDDRYAGVLDGRDAMVESLERSFPVYRMLGLASVDHELLDVTDLTDALTLVEVRWLFYDADGSQLTDSRAYYVVRRGDAGLQACACIQTDDAEKLQALATERGIDLTQLGP